MFLPYKYITNFASKQSLLPKKVRTYAQKAHTSAKNQFFFHTLCENRSSIGKISNLPANISKVNTSLEKILRSAKFAIGPTASKPGPTLLKQVKTVENVVPTVSLSNSETSTKLMTRIIPYAVRYPLVLEMTRSSTARPLTRTTCTCLGCKRL